MYKKKTTNKMIKANCGASVKAHGKKPSVKAHGKAKAMKLQSGGMIGKIKKNEVFGTEEKRQENLDRYMSGTKGGSSGRLAYNKGGAIGSSRSGAIGSSRGDTPEEEDIRAARRYKNGKNNKNGMENTNGRK